MFASGIFRNREQLIFLIDHGLTALGDDLVGLTHLNRFNGTSLFTKTTIDAATEIDLENFWDALFDVGIHVFAGLDVNRERWAHYLTEFAGHATFFTILSRNETWDTTISDRQSFFLFGILQC